MAILPGPVEAFLRPPEASGPYFARSGGLMVAPVRLFSMCTLAVAGRV